MINRISTEVVSKLVVVFLVLVSCGKEAESQQGAVSRSRDTLLASKMGFDYDGDGKADPTYFRPSDGKWYVRPSLGGADVSILYGDSKDWLVPGDYDGDGRTDAAVFRPSEGKWYAKKSSNGTVITAVVFGTSKDIPVPGDYDGDSKTDFAYFHRADASWHIRPSGGGADLTYFVGSATARLVPADYDGDGKTDPAVFDFNGNWTIRRSSTGLIGTSSYGEATDKPVQGDYDNDGKADIAVFRPRDRKWYVRRSSDNTDLTPIFFGEPTDRLQPADYDGDGKVDAAVFRPGDGTLYLRKSTDGTYASFVFGTSKDRFASAGRAVPPRPAGLIGDFDGDQRGDIVYFHREDGTWHIRDAIGGASSVTFGVGTDTPTSGDYDGDGRTDVSVFRPSTGTWYVRPSSGGSDFSAVFGSSTDIPTPGDFDGDGKFDYAFYRPTEGKFHVQPSSGGAEVITTIGNTNVVPVAADYDGDGIADCAVFTSDTGNWVVHPSAGGFNTSVQFYSGGYHVVPRDFDGDGRSDYAVQSFDGHWYVRGVIADTSYGDPYDVPTPLDYDGDGAADTAVFRPSNNTWYARLTGGSSDTGYVFGAGTDTLVYGPTLGWTTPVCPGEFCVSSGGCDCVSDCANQAIVCQPTLWPNGIVYYEIVSPELTDLVNESILSWTSILGGRLVFAVSNTQPGRIQFRAWSDSGGQSDSLGYSGGLQNVWFGVLTSPQAAAHEIGHAIGLQHEQKRGDRDRYISVIPNEFDCGSLWQSWKKCGESDYGAGFGVYNPLSLMHYRSTSQYYLIDRATGRQLLRGETFPTAKDGSDIAELYSRAYPGGGHNWTKFVSLSTSVSNTAPRNPAIPSPPAASNNVLPIGTPAVASQGGVGVIDYYVRGSDNHIYHRYQSGGVWYGYDDMGDVWASDPSAASWGAGTAAVVAFRYEADVRMRRYASSTWSSWTSLPSMPQNRATGSAPALVSLGGGDLQVFVLTASNTLLTSKYVSGSWSSWSAVSPATPSGVTFGGSPVVASQGAGNFDLFINSSNGTVWHTFYWLGAWAGSWDSPVTGAAANSTPAASSWGTGRVDVFFKGTDNQLMWKRYDGAWQTAVRLGGIMNSSPAAVSGASQRIDVFARGQDEGLWQRWYE